MWLVLIALAGSPAPQPKPPDGPGAAETAKLYFLAGDLHTAREWCVRGLKTEPKKCQVMLKQLAQYAFLADRRDRFTAAEARSFIELDRQISPQATSKLTDSTLSRFVRGPLERMHSLAKGDGAGARAVARAVLEVDPENAEARALLAADGGSSE